MKKEHLETLEKTNYYESNFVMYLLNHIVDVDLASESIIQNKEVDESLTRIGNLLKELIYLSEEKESLVDNIIMDEDAKELNKSIVSKRR